MKWGLSVHPDIFLELDYSFFLNFGNVLEIHMTLSETELDFFFKKDMTQKLKNWGKNRVFRIY